MTRPWPIFTSVRCANEACQKTNRRKNQYAPGLGMKLYTAHAPACWTTCATLGVFAAVVIWRVARPAQK